MATANAIISTEKNATGQFHCIYIYTNIQSSNIYYTTTDRPTGRIVYPVEQHTFAARCGSIRPVPVAPDAGIQ